MMGRNSDAEAGRLGDASHRESIANDWETVVAALAEFGLSTDSGKAVSAADVVLAAQVRLRYWRRQLRVGELHQPTFYSALTTMSGKGVAAGEETIQADPSAYPVGDFTFVWERIRTIQSARDQLLRLDCFRQGTETVSHLHS